MAAAVAQLKLAASLAGEDSLNRLLLLQLLVQQAVSGALAAGQWQVQLFQAQALASKPALLVLPGSQWLGSPMWAVHCHHVKQCALLQGQWRSLCSG